jgi:hypothetical protein
MAVILSLFSSSSPPPPSFLYLFVCVAALGDVLGTYALVKAP